MKHYDLLVKDLYQPMVQGVLYDQDQDHNKSRLTMRDRIGRIKEFVSKEEEEVEEGTIFKGKMCSMNKTYLEIKRL